MVKVNVRENLEFFGRYKGMENLTESVDYILEAFEMTKFADSIATDLSVGQ